MTLASREDVDCGDDVSPGWLLLVMLLVEITGFDHFCLYLFDVEDRHTQIALVVAVIVEASNVLSWCFDGMAICLERDVQIIVSTQRKIAEIHSYVQWQQIEKNNLSSFSEATIWYYSNIID